MTGPSNVWLIMVIGSALVVALVRLALWRRAAPSAETSPRWRLPALISLNLIAGALLYLTLDPPDVGVRSGRLVVLTAGAPARVAEEPGDIVVALPEGPMQTEPRAPDLASALRRYPDTRLIQVVGVGLTMRDWSSVDRPLVFDAPPAPVGFVRLDLPEPVTAGAPFAVGGTVGRLSAGSVELVDPSGAVVDRTTASAGSDFVLRGAARSAGLAVFDLRLKDAAGRFIERIDVPLEAREATPPRAIVMAGAPGPEPLFLRRWAEQAGIDLTVRLALGAGVDLSTRSDPLTAQTLSRTDLLVIDERQWEALSPGERAAVGTATAGGMGLLLRPTGPLSAVTRRDWAALGAPLTGGDTLRPVTLEGATSRDQGPEPSGDTPGPPELSRRDFARGGDAAVLIADADGQALATWRPYGDGRVGVWVLADSYALVLTGQKDRYGALWSRMFSQLARPEGARPPRLSGLARAGERAAICGISAADSLVAPDGSRSRLVLDPRAGPTSCAAVWPRVPGWHAIVDADGERGVVFVHPSTTTPSLIASEIRRATLDLQAGAGSLAAGVSSRRSGSPLPWLLGFLLAATALWWLERRRPSQPPSAGPA